MAQNKESAKQKIQSTLVSTTGRLSRVSKSPDETFGELFADVQNSNIYGDGKVFSDFIPRTRPAQIKQEYLIAKNDPNFDLQDFIGRHFYVSYDKPDVYKTADNVSIEDHISGLWKVLERTQLKNEGSLIALPYPYVVPGGRFSEQFYWDSYFIMRGLASDGKWSVVEGMIDNFAYMIRKFGFIPTANRTYFLSRSQPPFFALMIELLATHKGKSVLVKYLPYLVAEYRFWMKGRRKLAKMENRAFARVAEMPNGVLLNRYYDNKKAPRPESFREDTTIATSATSRELDRLYLHLRAGAESGWDFSSRWLREPSDLRSIYTADIIPVDLNSLLYQLEKTISQAYRLAGQKLKAESFQAMADRRRRAVSQYLWSTETRYFEDYNFHYNAKTNRTSLAGVFPLFVGIASDEQAGLVAGKIRSEFLKDGGLLATLTETGQQWDAPNGWAPLHLIAIEGLRNYGHDELADEIKKRWVNTNLNLFDAQGRLVEKYDVINPDKLGGGGEYPLQDGFGWTNGVLSVLLKEKSI